MSESDVLNMRNAAGIFSNVLLRNLREFTHSINVI